MTKTARVFLIAILIGIVAAPIVAAVSPMLTHRGESAGDFTLSDQTGHPFTLSDQRGKAVLIFFGYTHCPDVCPTTLAAIGRAYKQLGSPQDLKVAFITVDPKRDSAQALGNYMKLFDPSFIGLSGDEAALKAVYKEYGVYVEIAPDASSTLGYSVTHSAAVYVIDKSGAIVDRLDWSSSPKEFASALRKVVS
jgi:protein SCO1/2